MAVRFLVALVLLAASVLLYRHYSETDESRIRTLLEQLEADLQLKQPEALIPRASASKSIASYFSDTLRYRLPDEPEQRSIEQRELIQRIITARTELTKLEVKLDPGTITIKGDEARIEAIVSALGATRSGSGEFFDRHRGTITLKRSEGGWKIHEVLHLENLRGSPGRKGIY